MVDAVLPLPSCRCYVGSRRMEKALKKANVEAESTSYAASTVVEASRLLSNASVRLQSNGILST